MRTRVCYSQNAYYHYCARFRRQRRSDSVLPVTRNRIPGKEIVSECFRGQYAQKSPEVYTTHVQQPKQETNQKQP